MAEVVDDGSTVQTFNDGSALVTEPPGSEPDIPPSAPVDEATAERKTEAETVGEIKTDPQKPDSEKRNLFDQERGPKLLAATERNILHNYRSWTYNFALAAVTQQALANPRLLENDIKKYPVLNSAGKGTAGLSVFQGGENRQAGILKDTTGLVDGFNKNSPGRFDMFIDNVEIKSVVGAGSPTSGSSVPTNIKFDVFEPYSMNGFIEALQVSAKAAGYTDYLKAVYALRVQFQGYPDTVTNAQMRSEIIPMSTRYFTITMVQVDVDVNEQGTRYKIEAAPTQKMVLGLPNKLTTDIKVSGGTVGEVLKNFFDAINEMVEDGMEAQRGPGKRRPSDVYEISCPKISTVGNPQSTKAAVLTGSTGTSFTSDIVKSKMLDELKSAEIFQMGDPARFRNGYVGTAPASTTTNTTSSANPSTGKLNPKTNTVVFAQGKQIHDCIAAIVRDSEYTRDLLTPENLKKVKEGNGYVTYFTVRTEIEFLPGFDEINNKNYFKYRYVLEPYKIHYSRIPGQQLGKIDLKDIKDTIKREYNYIYTGKNEDVLKFNLNFNNLYYSAMPVFLGKSGRDTTAESAAPNNQVNNAGENAPAIRDNANAGETSVPLSSVKPDPTQSTYQESARGILPQGDPYTLMAKNLYRAILDDVALITGQMEILGDPYYLVTGGMYNGDLVLKDPQITIDGQAPITQGDVYININFRNPVDINSNTGLLDFGKTPLAFSGVYRVTTLNSSFRGGVFTQNLDVVRMEGQIVGKETEILPPDGKTAPRPGQQVIKDTALASILRSGVRPSEFNLGNLLSRGLPSLGLPGNVSNFTNALTSAAGGAGSLLNQVAGAAGVANQLSNQIGVTPVGFNALTSGIRLSASGLSAIASTPDLAAATITAAGKAIGNIANVPNAAVKLASNTVDSLTALPGTLVSAAKTNPLVQNVSGLATKAFDQVSSLIGDSKNSVAYLQNNNKADLASVGSKLGIDTSAIAGLSPELQSKVVDQLADVAKSVPPGADLGELKSQGVTFANLTKDQIANLPAVQPKAIAPSVPPDPSYADIASKFGDVSPLLAKRPNLSPLTDINNVTNPLGSLTAGADGILRNKQSIFGSVSAANTYVNDTIGSVAGIKNTVGSLSQNSISGFSPASIGLGSVESNLNTVANLTQNPTSAYNKLGISVSNQFGSLQASPLTKLIRDNNIEGSV